MPIKLVGREKTSKNEFCETPDVFFYILLTFTIGVFFSNPDVCRFWPLRYGAFAESAMMIHQHLDALTRETIRVRDERKRRDTVSHFNEG